MADTTFVEQRTAITFADDPALDYDAESEKGGVIVDFGEGKTVTVARAGGTNHRFAEIAQAIEKPFKFLIDNRKLPPERRRELNINIFADACIVAFAGWTDARGDMIPYSKEGARALLRQNGRVFEKVVEIATEGDNYTRARKLEAIEAAKNS